MQRVLFIHRSVGHNLLHDGGIRQLIAQSSRPFELDDYHHNSDRLTLSDKSSKLLGFRFPGGDTTPRAYASIFTNTPGAEAKAIRDFALAYDGIVIKSCYPNSNIASDEELEAIKHHYRQIAAFFGGRPGKQLVILTSPPMARLMTTASKAARGRQLATWLSSADFGNNVRVFNLFDRLAADPDSMFANCLRWSYQRWLPFDSHPSAKASREIAPHLVKFLAEHATIAT